jgi:hypothetical protein
LMKNITDNVPNYIVKFVMDIHIDTHHRNIQDLSAKCMEIMTLQVKSYYPFPEG